MQTQQKFLEILKNPYNLDRNTLTFLENLTYEFPYCQSLQILLAKNLQSTDKLAFEKQVNKASAYAVDRRRFQWYISDRDKPRPKNEIPPASIIKDFSKPSIVIPLTDNVELEGFQSGIINQEATEVKLSSTEIKHDNKSLSLLEIVRKRLEEIRKKNEDLNKVEVEQKINSGIVSEISTVQKVNETIPVIEKVLPPEESGESHEQPTEIQPTETLETFPYPLKGRQAKKPDINYLIDKFLKEEPRIIVKKDFPQKQEDLSAKSSNENPQLVTETLALVYLKQGRKDKALDIYEKLCLKFPEKSSYFAQKITAIINEIN